MNSDGISKQSMGARNRVGIGLSYRHPTGPRLVESIHWNIFLGSSNVYKFGLSLLEIKKCKKIKQSGL
jgi:hypothetical protein